MTGKHHETEKQHKHEPDPKPDPRPDDPKRLGHHAEAVRVAEYLRGRGLPVAGVDLAVEEEIGVTFRLPNGELVTVSRPREGAVEHLDDYANAYVVACAAIGREPVKEA